VKIIAATKTKMPGIGKADASAAERTNGIKIILKNRITVPIVLPRR
jgi:hypothetical protein